MKLRFRVDAVMREQHVREMELAVQARVARGTIRALRRNASTRVDLSTMERLAAVLGVRPSDLFEDVEQPAAT